MCGWRFREPQIEHRRERLDGDNGWWYYTEELCPNCGDGMIYEIEEDDE